MSTQYTETGVVTIFWQEIDQQKKDQHGNYCQYEEQQVTIQGLKRQEMGSLEGTIFETMLNTQFELVEVHEICQPTQSNQEQVEVLFKSWIVCTLCVQLLPLTSFDF